MPNQIATNRETRAALLQQLSDAVRQSQNDTDAFDQAVADHLGLNRTDLRCLDVIDREAPVSAGRLAELAGLSTGAVTSVLDRLEQAGHVRRARDAGDRRRVLIELTDEMRRLNELIWGPLEAAYRGGMGRYGDEELVLLRDFFRGGREVHEQAMSRLAELTSASAGADGRD